MTKKVPHYEKYTTRKPNNILAYIFRNSPQKQVQTHFVGTTRASGHKTRSDQKYAESSQLRLGLLKHIEIVVFLLF